MYDSDIEDDALAFWLGCLSLIILLVGIAAIAACGWAAVMAWRWWA